VISYRRKRRSSEVSEQDKIFVFQIFSLIIPDTPLQNQDLSKGNLCFEILILARRQGALIHRRNVCLVTDGAAIRDIRSCLTYRSSEPSTCLERLEPVAWDKIFQNYAVIATTKGVQQLSQVLATDRLRKCMRHLKLIRLPQEYNHDVLELLVYFLIADFFRYASPTMVSYHHGSL